MGKTLDEVLAVKSAYMSSHITPPHDAYITSVGISRIRIGIMQGESLVDFCSRTDLTFEHGESVDDYCITVGLKPRTPASTRSALPKKYQDVHVMYYTIQPIQAH